MAAVITSVADVVNLSLRNIGYKLRVGHLYDGSDAANQCLDIYGQTRDDALRDGDWHFCERTVSLGDPLKSAPSNYFDAAWNPADSPPPPCRAPERGPWTPRKPREIGWSCSPLLAPITMKQGVSIFAAPRAVNRAPFIAVLKSWSDP